MHEFSIARKLLEAVLEEAKEKKAREVKEIWIELGELADITEEELRQALGVVSKDTIAERVKININMKSPKMECGKGHESVLEKENDYSGTLFLSCPKCGTKALVTGGRECNIARVRAE